MDTDANQIELDFLKNRKIVLNSQITICEDMYQHLQNEDYAKLSTSYKNELAQLDEKISEIINKI